MLPSPWSRACSPTGRSFSSILKISPLSFHVEAECLSCSESRHRIDVHMNFSHFSWPRPRLLCLRNKHCEPVLKRLFWSSPSSSRGSKQKCLQNNIKGRPGPGGRCLLLRTATSISAKYDHITMKAQNCQIFQLNKKKIQKLGLLFQFLDVGAIKVRAGNRRSLMCSPGQTGLWVTHPRPLCHSHKSPFREATAVGCPQRTSLTASTLGAEHWVHPKLQTVGLGSHCSFLHPSQTCLLLCLCPKFCGIQIR